MYYSGNQYVHISIQIPKNLNDKQRQLLHEFQREEIRKAGGDPGEESQGPLEEGMVNKFCGVKMPFSIEEAWKRVKNYMNKSNSSTGAAAGGGKGSGGEKSSDGDKKAQSASATAGDGKKI